MLRGIYWCSPHFRKPKITYHGIFITSFKCLVVLHSLSYRHPIDDIWWKIITWGFARQSWYIGKSANLCSFALQYSIILSDYFTIAHLALGRAKCWLLERLNQVATDDFDYPLLFIWNPNYIHHSMVLDT